MGKRTRPGRARWRLAAALAAGALVLAGCGSGAGGETPTRTARSSPAVPTKAAPRATPDGPVRWGYDPSALTGELDPQARFTALPAGYRIETVVAGLEQPAALAFTPDGRLLVAQQRGAVRLVEDGRLRPEPYFMADVYYPELPGEIVELGLVGMAVDPAFVETGHVYLYYTADGPRRTVLARVQDAGDRAENLEEIVTLDAAPECCHVGGSLRFAADGTLFVSVGDHQMEDEAQDRGSPFGAILRVDREGNPPADNPFAGVEDADPRVYAYGLRNPYDVAIHPLNGRIFATENGFLGQDAIIELQPGANYGWPGSDLAVPLEEVAPPLLFYHEPIGPAGIELYAGDALPELRGGLLFCQFHRGGALHVVRFRLDGEVAEDTIIAPGCSSDVLTGPDGFVYFLDYVGGTVYRIAAGGR